jgi:hypothetical protein
MYNYNTMTSCCNGSEEFGANPVSIKWNIVRGDTSPLRVEFYQDDEVTYFDTTTWTYSSTVYDYRADVIDELVVTPGYGYVDITATPAITALWGTGYKSVVAELAFDLQVTIDDVVWTPVIGTISVLGDVTGGSL